MRPAEWIHLAAFLFFCVLSWIRALPGKRRARATGIGALGLAANFIGAFFLPPWARDWLPAALMLLVYWQTGQFFVRVDRRFEDRLEAIDARLLARLFGWLAERKRIVACLELAYAFCYPLIPLSFATLYWLGLAQHADRFWTVVLGSTYLSYGALPFVQTRPPRVLAEPWLPPLPQNRVRAVNLWILRQGSIQANTFPSGHVAASTGAALVVIAVAPWPAGLLWGAAAATIALGTITGRYHFAADVIGGAAVAGAVFLAA